MSLEIQEGGFEAEARFRRAVQTRRGPALCCGVCGASFVPRPQHASRARYCSEACLLKAYSRATLETRAESRRLSRLTKNGANSRPD